MNRPYSISMLYNTDIFDFNYVDVQAPQDREHQLMMSVEATTNTEDATSLNGGEIEIMIDGNYEDHIFLESSDRNYRN